MGPDDQLCDCPIDDCTCPPATGPITAKPDGWNGPTHISPAPSDREAPSKSLIRENAEQDPNYAPYCLRCRAMKRMPKVEPFFWRCVCGAEHDEREAPPIINSQEIDNRLIVAREAPALDTDRMVDLLNEMASELYGEAESFTGTAKWRAHQKDRGRLLRQLASSLPGLIAAQRERNHIEESAGEAIADLKANVFDLREALEIAHACNAQFSQAVAAVEALPRYQSPGCVKVVEFAAVLSLLKPQSPTT